MMIGRYQPFHDGHKALVQKLLDEGKNVLLALRDTEIDKKNPYTYDQRFVMIYKEFANEMDVGKVKVMLIPDIEEVVYGRKVGWSIREIRLDAEIEKISATAIRRKNECTSDKK